MRRVAAPDTVFLMPHVPRFVLAAVLVAATAGCGLGRPAPDPVIDTWPVGPALDCEDFSPPGGCAELVRVGLEGFDRRDPGHAAVVSSQLHSEGAALAPNGDRILYTRSGACCSVLVMTLDDGSIHAIGVGSPGISPNPVAIDREVTPAEMLSP